MTADHPLAPSARRPEAEPSDRAWLASMPERSGLEAACQMLDAQHGVARGGSGKVLLVSFESFEEARHAREDEIPEAIALADEEDWAFLCLFSAGPTWFRSPQVYAFFDQLIDDGYFDRFARVVFAGVGAGGYAAAAYSVAAPGATVIAVQPQATLDPAVTGWDERFLPHRRLPFNDRFGFAPDMLDGAARAFILFDPDSAPDAMHAALFRRGHVALAPMRGLAPHLDLMLSRLRILPRLMAAAGEGRLDLALVYRLWRRRREIVPYLLALTSRLEGEGRLIAAGLVARNTARRLDGPRPRQQLAQILTQLEAAGTELPPERVKDAVQQR